MTTQELHNQFADRIQELFCCAWRLVGTQLYQNPTTPQPPIPRIPVRTIQLDTRPEPTQDGTEVRLTQRQALDLTNWMKSNPRVLDYPSADLRGILEALCGQIRL